jgi:uncharacterized protein (DUF924 family)
MNPAVLDDVHAFWFGALDGPEATSDRWEQWFQQNDDFDRTIREQFGEAMIGAAAAAWKLDDLTRTQQVGLVILLDQFPRNIHRSDGSAFAYDATARRHAEKLIAGGVDRFFLVERPFLFLPLMHSEAVADQDRCVLLLASEALRAPEEWTETFRLNLDFATKHRDLIRKFGRFPHRNAMLGRATTEEEAAFLAEHGRGF